MLPEPEAQMMAVVKAGICMNQKTKWILTVVLAVIEIFLTVADLGFFTIGRIAFTVLHIPIFIATTLIGLPQGVVLAGIFGLSSLVSAYWHPSGMLDYLFQNPMVSVVPRLMVPIAVYFVYKTVCRIADDHTISAKLICVGFSALCGVIANAVFVIMSVAILSPSSVGITDNLSASTIVVTNIVAVNIFYEIVLAVSITCLTALVLNKLGILEVTAKGRKFSEAGETDAESAADISAEPDRNALRGGKEMIYDKPLQKTFRKWLFLFIVTAFFLMLFFLYYLFSKQDQEHARALLQSKTDEILRQIDTTGNTIVEEDLGVGSTGFITIAKKDEILISGKESMEVSRLSDLCPGYEKLVPDSICDMVVDGYSGMGIVQKVNDIVILSFIPDSEIYMGRNRTLAYLLGGLLAMHLLLFEMISVIVRKDVVQKIQEVNGSLSQIRAGNLDEKVTVSGNTEFEELSQGINTTVDALKKTMREIAEQNKREMEFAREVQNSALPSGSLVSHGDPEIVVLGSMEAAREVGGDFYDYFRIGEEKLGIVVADVSGKGVPAALFMMTAKTLIKNFVLAGESPAKALQLANAQLCENNEKGMFVTVWLGVMDLRSCTMEFANAAHNPPLLKKSGEPFRYMDFKQYRRGFVLAGLEDTLYRNNEITLGKGDVLFLYTDGVTEAANTDLKLYGEQRLLECLEANYQLAPEELLRAVRADIRAFTSGAEQYDDITMVVLKME